MSCCSPGKVIPCLCLAFWSYAVLAAPETRGARFHFSFPDQRGFLVEASGSRQATPDHSEWLKAWPESGSTNFVELGNRVILQVKAGTDLRKLLDGHPLKISRTVAANVFILQAPDALTAATESQRLANLSEVTCSHPDLRRQYSLHGPYASQPTDSFYTFQWALEHRTADGPTAGVDLNVRAAWPYTTGEGITIAAADTGVELVHPELISRVSGAPHFNFAAGTTNAGPVSGTPSAAHGTEVAGLAVAEMNNARMVGVAPGAKLASWVIFTTNLLRATEEQMLDAYQYRTDVVSIQNHSWGFVGLGQNLPGLVEQIGISNAVTYGRSGRGVIMVRSAGNDRLLGANANDDGYPADPRAVAVAAVRLDGRVASYSEPGACVLVAAPSGDQQAGFDGLFTTDLLGTRGFNQISFFPPFEDLSGYVFNQLGFSGTSASAPQIAAVAALILSANTNLTYRDVQQILLLSARHFDPGDPDLVTTGAGLLVSHNDGFGVPDAGVAVSLARTWVNRPPLKTISFTSSDAKAIPDDGLKVAVTNPNTPKQNWYIQTLPSTGPHADEPTPTLPLVDVGLATNALNLNLTNRGALIERGGTLLADKINFAARAGAAFAVVYNFATNATGSGAPGGDQLIPIGGADFVPIPAVFIGHTDGVALKNLIQTDSQTRARIQLQTVDYSFRVHDTLLCEQVGLRVKTDHPLRGDVRITLVSPAGTRSVLQRYNADESAGPVDWTYYSTHHFYETSAGIWTAFFSDEGAGNSGTVHEVSLILSGVPIRDHDHDGLDDRWERDHFHSFAQGAQDDPDQDGYWNMREQVMGTDPNQAGLPFRLDLSRWNQTRARLSWAGSPNFIYEILAGTNPASLSVITNVPGNFPETEWFTRYDTPARQFFRVRAIPLR